MLIKKRHQFRLSFKYHMDLHMIQRRLMTPLNIYEKGYSCEVRS